MVTDMATAMVYRTHRPRSPERYLRFVDEAAPSVPARPLSGQDLVLEFMLNALRLKRGFSRELFEQRTGLALSQVGRELDLARSRGLLQVDAELICPTDMGMRFLNELLAIFLQEERATV